jgi:hypothetical protein
MRESDSAMMHRLQSGMKEGHKKRRVAGNSGEKRLPSAFVDYQQRHDEN